MSSNKKAAAVLVLILVGLVGLLALLGWAAVRAWPDDVGGAEPALPSAAPPPEAPSAEPAARGPAHDPGEPAPYATEQAPPTISADPPQGVVSVGGAGVAGGEIPNAQAVVARLRGRMRRCYQTGLSHDPGMQGSMTLTAHVAPDGSVAEVSGSGSASLASVVPCMKAVVAAAVFAPPGRDGALVTIPITCVMQ